MAKFSPQARLSKKEEQDLLLDFFRSLGTIHGFKDVAMIFQDLLSRSELTMLAKRLKIAKLLLQGKNYQDITRTLKVSSQTIARINIWLQEAGDGFRAVFERTKNKDISNEDKSNSENYYSPWVKIRRSYPMYFWPEILIKEIIALANQQQKKRLYQTLSKLQIKGKLNKDLAKLLKN
ncbi:MAG: YerC/YecD family TrpR-related protein [Patescibacteria group bacterium]